MKVLIVTFCLFIHTILAAGGPKYNDIWYFGLGAGLDFRSGAPKVLTDGVIDTWEGCDVICDAAGNLLFYSNGVSVWDRTHREMPNGNGLKGNLSSTQSCIIIPKPGDDSTYYIFTTSDYSRYDGFNYSIVDLRLNGGFGGVSIKNVSLLDDVPEKVTVIKHNNNKDYWILTHKWESDEFLAYLVTSESIISNVVTTKIGSVIGGYQSNKVGCIKANAEGNKVSIVSLENPFIEFFSFDNKTGKLANARKLESPFFKGAYCLEFSPDSKKLYLSIYGGSVSSLYQLDLTYPNDYEIVNNMVNLSFEPTAYYYGTLQLAPDGKIYVAQYNTDYLGVINNPDAAGLACNFVAEGIFLNGKKSKFGLPQSIQTMRPPEVNYIFDNPVCLGGTIRLAADSIFRLTYQWTGPGGFMANTRTAALDNVTLANEGEYRLEIIDSNGVTNLYTFNIDVIENRFEVNNATDSDFGATCPGDIADKTFFVENKGSDPIRLESVTFQNSTGVFSFKSVPLLGTELKPGDIADITISFLPNDIRNYDDVVIIKSANPCSSEFIFSIKASGNDKTTIFIPDTNCTAGDNNFSIPVYARLGCSDAISGAMSFEAEIQINPDAFSLSENNDFVNSQKVENGKLKINISADNIRLNSKLSRIAELNGAILLPVSSITPVDITSFRWTNNSIEFDTNGGSLIITGDCLFDTKKVSNQNPGLLMIYPNPTSGIATIISDKKTVRLENTVKEIAVIDYLGRNVTDLMPIKGNQINNDNLNIDISMLPAGLYYLDININDWIYRLKIYKF